MNLVHPDRSEPRGIRSDAVSSWFEQHIQSAQMPLAFELMAGGRSNLTYLVSDAAGTRYVLRRSPTGNVLPTAHDMVREHRIISRLASEGIPLPRVLGICHDEGITGAPIYVMDFIEGAIFRSEEDARDALNDVARHRAGVSLIITLAQHSVDPKNLGLPELGQRPDYIASQLKRWHANYLASLSSREA